MKKTLLQNKRQHLQKKMMATFKEEMENLTKDLQQTLADDLVTAFQNRLKVFLRIQSKQTY